MLKKSCYNRNNHRSGSYFLMAVLVLCSVCDSDDRVSTVVVVCVAVMTELVL